MESFSFFDFISYFGDDEPDFSGMTSCLKKQGDLVVGVCCDKAKLDYMKEAELPGFAIVDEVGESFVYKMDFLKPLSQSQEDEIDEKIKRFKKEAGSMFSINDRKIELIEELFGEKMAKGVKKSAKRKLFIDISLDQFLTDGTNIYCVDAVMDMRIYEEITNS